MRALVTGADGFIGAHLCKALLQAGHDVTAATANRSGRSTLDVLGVDVRREYGDIQDAEYVRRIINAREPDWVFHLAAVSIVRVANRDLGRALRTNIDGTINVLEACERNNVQAVVTASSDKAYGSAGGHAYVETMALRPFGPYEVSKACADHIARLYGRGTLRSMVTRSCNVFGPADLNWSRLIPGACRTALAGKPPTVYSGGVAREYVCVDDVVGAYIHIARHGEIGHAYNVGSGWVASAQEVASQVARMAGAPEPVLVDAPCYEIPSQVINASKLHSLGWSPTVHASFGEALAATFEWYRGYPCGS